MGITNRYYFPWLNAELSTCDAQTGMLTALKQAGRVRISALGETTLTPVLANLQGRLGPAVDLMLFDKYPKEPESRYLDLNDLGALPSGSCDLMTAFRCSLFITDAERFFVHAARIVRPRGLLCIDWVHGGSGTPMLATHPTYVDEESLRTCAADFKPYLRHVRRPQWWRRSRYPELTVDTYATVLRRHNPHIVDPALVSREFEVVFRAARYFHPWVRQKYQLVLFTMLLRRT